VCDCSLSYPVCITHYFCFVLYCSLWSVWLYHSFCTLSHERQSFGEYLLNTNCVFWISVQILSDTLCIPITVQSHITITVPTVHFHVHYWLSSHNSVTVEFSTEFRKVGQKDGQTDLRSWKSFSADIYIIGVFCLPVALQTAALQTWHTGCSVHNILLQFPHHTTLKATNTPTVHTLLGRLTSYILGTFLFQDTSCVMLYISPINILMSLLPHDQLPINSITNDHTVKLYLNYC
jgi:hypothetical protein